MNQFINLMDTVDMSDGWEFSLTTFRKFALGIASPILVPIAIGLLVGSPIALSWDFKKWQKRTNAMRNLETYIDDPVGFVEKRTMKVLEKVCEYDVVYEYVFNQMEPARVYLEDMKRAIPKLIETNKELIESIVNDKRTKAEIEEKYLGLEKIIPNLQNSLAAFCNEHIRKYEYKKTDVTVLPPELVLGRVSRKLTLWTEISQGRIEDKRANGMAVPVSIVTFRKKVSDQHLLIQETHFRKAYHPHVANLLGVYEEKKGIPGLLIEPNLIKARQELFGFKALPKSSRGRYAVMQRCKAILEQIGMGIEYLHYKGLVNMELSLDTVMLIPNKDHVKLINITEPRKADLPETLCSEAADDYVYLSLHVLNGNIYKAGSDIYSLGLILAELWNQEKVFKHQRKQELSQFIANHKSNLEQLLSISDIDQTAITDSINPFAFLTVQCLQDSAARITSTVFVNELKKISIISGEEQEDL